MEGFCPESPCRSVACVAYLRGCSYNNTTMTMAIRPLSDAATANELLEPWRDQGTSLAVRCGKCRRKFGEAAPHSQLPVIVIEGLVEPGWGAPKLKAGELHWPRPSMSIETDEDLTTRFRCHKKCGGRWPVTRVGFLAAFVRAAHAGRSELVLGDNL
jgi:hypothetical protein